MPSLEDEILAKSQRRHLQLARALLNKYDYTTAEWDAAVEMIWDWADSPPYRRLGLMAQMPSFRIREKP